MDDMKVPGIELFEVLIATAESRNLVQAAEKLKISQPAVSVKLKELDRLAPLPLFSYEGKRKVLTHYGRELYKIAKLNQEQMSAKYEDLNRQYASAESLTLKVGARRELFGSLTSHLKFPGRVSFLSMTSQEAVRQLMDHKIDIAISYSVPDSAEIMAKKAIESSAQLVIHKRLLKTKFSKELVRDKDFLLETPCVLYQEDGHLLNEWVSHLNIPFERLNVHGIAEDWRTVQALVTEGWGYGIVPSYVVSSDSDVASIPLPDSVLPKFVFYALFYRDLKKIPAFSEIIERLTRALL
jgi:LysR family transcriptional regulator, glycine cleavage system transcriptional activator